MIKKFAKVQFDIFGTHYVFKNEVNDIEVGDQVVVDTVNDYSIGTVTSFLEESTIGTKYVVQKIDEVSHKARLDRDKKIATIRHKMDARRKELQEIEIFRILAKEDTGMADLLKELEVLGK